MDLEGEDMILEDREASGLNFTGDETGEGASGSGDEGALSVLILNMADVGVYYWKCGRVRRYAVDINKQRGLRNIRVFTRKQCDDVGSRTPHITKRHEMDVVV